MARYDFEKQDAVLRDQPLRVTRHIAVNRYLCPVCRQEFVQRSEALACAHIGEVQAVPCDVCGNPVKPAPVGGRLELASAQSAHWRREAQRFRDALLKVERLVCSALHPAAGGDDSEETTDA